MLGAFASSCTRVVSRELLRSDSWASDGRVPDFEESLRPDGIGQALPADANPPANLAPVRAGVAEFLWFRALTTVATDDDERSDACIAE